MVKLNGFVFRLKTMAYGKNVLIFGIKSVVILKKAKDFHNNKISKVASHPTCLAVIMVDPVFKNDEKTIIKKCSLKNLNTMKKSD